MSTAPQVLFQVKPEGYGYLTIESFTSIGVTPAAGAGPTIGQPPIPQPFEDPSGNGFFARPWARFFIELASAASKGGGDDSDFFFFLAPSVDETDSEWYGTGTIDASTNPSVASVTLTGQSRYGVTAKVIDGGSGYTAATFTITGTGGTGQPAAGTATVAGGAIVDLPVTTNGYGLVAPLTVNITGDGTLATAQASPGRQWNVGDYVIWNDPTIVGTKYQYEIDQLTAITAVDDGSATFTFTRIASTSIAGEAFFGSPMGAHTTRHFYRLIPQVFTRAILTGSGPQIYRLPWDNMMVAAVLCFAPDIDPVLINLAPAPYTPGTTDIDPRNSPPCPGLRTMNGAAYTGLGIIGDLTSAATSTARESCMSRTTESIRCVFIRAIEAPTGAVTFNGDANACVVCYVFYIALDGTVGLIDTVVIDDGNFDSFIAANTYEGRQMPFHFYWPTQPPNVDWPPNRLPVNTTGLDTNGLLQLPVVIDPTQTVLFGPPGQIDFILSQVGATISGATMIATVQT